MTRHLHAVANAHLELSRIRKAEKLVAVLVGHARKRWPDATPSELVAALNRDQTRSALLRVAGYERASDETWAVARRLLLLGEDVDAGGAA